MHELVALVPQAVVCYVTRARLSRLPLPWARPAALPREGVARGRRGGEKGHSLQKSGERRTEQLLCGGNARKREPQHVRRKRLRACPKVVTPRSASNEIALSREKSTTAMSRPSRDVAVLTCPSANRVLVMLLILATGLQTLLLVRTAREAPKQPCNMHSGSAGAVPTASLQSHPPPHPPRPSNLSLIVVSDAIEAIESDANALERDEETPPDSADPVVGPWKREHAGYPSAAWGVAGEREKKGAGLLFFAYGGKQLGHFVAEAQAAAESFRRLNPRITIALVSNTQRALDNRTFNIHIRPRADLLLAGSTTNGNWNDNLPRQWFTRLYYLAHSPFHITWALDSNVFACTYGSAQAFLDDALRRDLWGYDIATANQRDGPMYPHNFNLVFRWSPRTSALMRDWLLLQVRRGLDTDDQKTLLFAQLRQVTAGGLAVGQVATPFAGAFYSAVSFKNEFASDSIRVSRVIRGPVHLVHTRNPSDCAGFNEHADKDRQVLQVAHKPRGAKKSTVTLRSALSIHECEIALAGGGLVQGLVNFSKGARQLCPFRDVGPRISHALHDTLVIAAKKRDTTAAKLNTTIKFLNKQLTQRGGFDSYNTSVKPLSAPRKLLGANVSWPPIFRPALEALNMSRHFGHVEIE